MVDDNYNGMVLQFNGFFSVTIGATKNFEIQMSNHVNGDGTWWWEIMVLVHFVFTQL